MSVIIPRLQRKPRLGARLDRQHPLSRGLVGCWLFNEGGGAKLWDISGNANHGTLINFDPSSDWVNNTRGPTLDFDATTTRISCGSSATIGTMGEMTICCTCYARSYGEGSQGYIVSKSGNFSTGWKFLNTTTSSLYRFLVDYTTTSLEVSSGIGDATIGQWNSLCVTYSSSSMLASDARIYKNGRELSYSAQINPAGSRVSETAKALMIGNDSLSDRTWDGNISDVRLYNRALSASEIRWLYTEPYANVVQPVYRRYFIPTAAEVRIPPVLVVQDFASRRGEI